MEALDAAPLHGENRTGGRANHTVAHALNVDARDALPNVVMNALEARSRKD